MNTVAAALNDRETRLALVQKSLYAFGVAYLPGVFSCAPAPFHWDWAKAYNAKRSVCVIGARDIGKTMWAVADVMRAICFKECGYVLWICQDQAKAQERLYDLTVQLQVNPAIRGDFGELYNGKQEKELEIKERKTMAEFITTNGVKVRALGLGAGVRGVNYIDKRGRSVRPDLIVLDDIDTVASVNTKTLIDQGYDKVKGEVFGAAGADCRYVVLGNVIKDDGISQRVYREMLGQVGWSCFWQPAIDKLDRITWPSRIFKTDAEADDAKAKGHKSPISLERKLREQKSVAFNQNFRLIPYQGTEAVIRAQDLRFASQSFEPGMGWSAVSLGVDPAISTKSLSDPFALVVSAKRPDGRVDVLEAVELKGEDKTTENAVFEAERLYRMWGCDRAAFEDVGFQKMLGQRLAERGMAVEYVRPNRDKAARLMEHQAKFESGLVSFNPDPSKGCAALADQLKNFPSVAHDDLIDAMVYSFGALESGGKMVLIPQE